MFSVNSDQASGSRLLNKDSTFISSSVNFQKLFALFSQEAIALDTVLGKPILVKFHALIVTLLGDFDHHTSIDVTNAIVSGAF